MPDMDALKSILQSKLTVEFKHQPQHLRWECILLWLLDPKDCTTVNQVSRRKHPTRIILAAYVKGW
jgi:hypothetical protein